VGVKAGWLFGVCGLVDFFEGGFYEL